jgi:hypothetical protein
MFYHGKFNKYTCKTCSNDIFVPIGEKLVDCPYCAGEKISDRDALKKPSEYNGKKFRGCPPDKEGTCTDTKCAQCWESWAKEPTT